MQCPKCSTLISNELAKVLGITRCNTCQVDLVVEEAVQTPQQQSMPEINRQYCYPLALVYARLVNNMDKSPALVSLFRLKDCFEIVMKYGCVIALALRYHLNLEESEEDKTLLADLVQPTTGTWHKMLEYLVKRLHTANEGMLEPMYQWLFGDNRTVAQILTDFVKMRNNALGHGAARSEAEYGKLVQEWLGHFHQVLANAVFLKEWLLLRRSRDKSECWMGLDLPTQVNIEIPAEWEGAFVIRAGTHRLLSLHPYIALLYCPYDKSEQMFFYDCQRRFDEQSKEVAMLEYNGGHKLETPNLSPAFEKIWGTAFMLSAAETFRKDMDAIEKGLYDFSGLRSQYADFVGREFVFSELQKFLRQSDRGYFLITGAPGIGKSAIVARYLEENPRTVHFFYCRASALTSDMMVQHCVRMLLQKYNIEDKNTAEDPERMRIKFISLLKLISERYLREGEKEVIWLDALDESGSEKQERERAVEVLCKELPPHIYFVLTSREGDHLSGFKAVHPFRHFHINSASEENMRDCVRYLEKKIGSQIAGPERLRQIVTATEGNFLVLRVFLDALVCGELETSTIDKDLRIKGLSNLYELFWAHLLKHAGDDASYRQTLFGIMGLLSVAIVPMTQEQLFAPLEIPMHRGEPVLRHLIQYLETYEVGAENRHMVIYRIYHSSFSQFVQDKLKSDFPLLFHHLTAALDREEPMARASVISLLYYWENEHPQKSQDSDEETRKLPCGKAILELLEKVSEEDVQTLLEFAEGCHKRGWWPREEWTLNQLEAASKTNPYPDVQALRMAEMNKQMGILAWEQENFEESRRHLALARDQFTAMGNREELAWVLYYLAKTYLWQDDYENAEGLYVAAASANPDANNDIAALIMKDRANITFLKGNNHVAMEMLAQATTLFQACGDLHGLADCNEIKGFIHYNEDQYEQARAQHVKELELYRNLHDLDGQAYTLSKLGDISYILDDISSAKQYYRDSLHLAIQIGDRKCMCDGYKNLGRVLSQRGEIAESLEHYQKSLVMAEEMGDRFKCSVAYTNIGDVKLLLGELEDAKECYEKTLEYDRSIGDTAMVGADMNDLAAWHLVCGNLAESEKYARQAYELLEGTKDQSRKNYNFRLLARLYLEKGLLDISLEMAHQAEVIAQSIHSPSKTLSSDVLLAKIRAQQGQFAGVVETMEKVMAEESRLGLVKELPDAYMALAEIHFLQSQFTQALEWGEDAAQRYADLGSPHQTAYANAFTAIARIYQGDTEGVTEMLSDSCEILELMGTKGLAAMANGWLGCVYHLDGQRDKAIACLRKATRWFVEDGANNALTHKIKAVCAELGMV